MKLLVACEESQRVCTEFRNRGHEAYSCDIIPTSGFHPEWHIQCDVSTIINGECSFKTCDGTIHHLDTHWDMIIAHPPCTRLCNSGQRWLYYGTEEYRKKKCAEQEEAIKFFMMFVNAPCEKIVIENPVGIMTSLYRHPDCIYNPYDFEGETTAKRTCLWVKGVEPLRGTRTTPLVKEKRSDDCLNPREGQKKYSWDDPDIKRVRSKTPIGVAKAMAEQWG